MTTALLVVGCALLGLIVGSFLTVVIWRVPRGESIVRPGSHCPRCGTPISPWDNIPVLSWVVLRGKCRHCGEPISARYPAIELITGGLFVVMALELGFDAALPAYLYLAGVGVALAVIDIDVKRLPNALTYPSYPVGIVLLGAAALFDAGATPFVRALLGMLVLFAGYFLLAFIYPAGMGFGDVKLAGVLGLYLAWIGWGALVVGAFAAFFIGGVAGIALMLFKGAGRKAKIPFGPYMLAGCLIGILWGQQIADAYVNATVG